MFVFLMTVFVTSCKGNQKDIEKQLEKMEELIDEEKIYQKDYLIEGNLSYQYSSTTITSYKFIKDEENYYIELNKTYLKE